MKKIISLTILAGLAVGCSQEKPQPEAKAPDTVVVVQQAAAIPQSSKAKHVPQPKKDVLDKTNDALDKANTTASKTNDALDKAAILKSKTDALLNH